MKKLRILSFLLVVILAVTLFTGLGDSVSVNAASGLTFSSDVYYTVNKAFTNEIKTIEATFTLPTNLSGRGGDIISNYGGQGNCFNFEIHENGNPYIYTIEDGRQRAHRFTNVNVATGKKVHVAITMDTSTQKVCCYVDGVLKETLTGENRYVAPNNISAASPLRVGGSHSSGNSGYFKGTLYSVAAYKTVRTNTQIVNDKNGIKTNDSNLIAAYEFNGQQSTINDLSGNGYSIKCDDTNNRWFTNKEPITDFDYSFVAIGDTQKVSRHEPEHMATIYDWVVNNISKKKIKFVMGLGDIIDWYQNDPSGEWKNVSAAIKKMDGKVPYSLCRGNHDGAADFNKYFPYSEYKNTVGGTYDNTSIINSWRKFEINGIKYMLFTLDYSPSDELLNWAGNLIAQNPTYNVIITTHMYLNDNATTLDGTEKYAPSISSGATHGPNDGDDIWDKLISKHANIVLVMSGHIPADGVVLAQTKGKNGTIVSQLLVDPSGRDTDSDGADGKVAILYFSNGGSRVTVEYYSTVKQKYYMVESQFSFDIAVIDSNGSTKPSTSTTKTTTTTKKTTSTTKSTTSTTKPTTSSTTGSSVATSSSATTASNTSQNVSQGDQNTTTTTSQSLPAQGNTTSQNPPTQNKPIQNSTTAQNRPSQGDSVQDKTTSQNQSTQNSSAGDNQVTGDNTPTTTQAGGDNVQDQGTDNTIIWVFVGLGTLVFAWIVILVLVARKRK